MITNNKQAIEEMKLYYNWTGRTSNTYEIALNNYTNFNKLSLDELIKEAETEEETINKPGKRTIKKRLINYRIHLQTKYSPHTVKNYTSMICKIYRHYEIETPRLPPIKITNKETFEDIPTRDEIKKAILHSRTKMKALITFIASTGLRRSDVSNLKIKDFITATNEFHNNNDDLMLILQQIQKNKFVIATWDITDIKTGITHISFSSPESSIYISQMLLERVMKEEVSVDDSLFDVKPDSISKNFRNINNKLGMGWKDYRRHFHPHALRKYFATTLMSCDVDFLSIEFLLGHTISKVQSSYYFANPEKLKRKYEVVVDNLMFNFDVSYVRVEAAELRELEELREYKRETSERIKRLEDVIDLI